MNRLKRKYTLLLCMSILSISLYGCWDYFDAEKRGYVLGIAIDKIPSDRSEVSNMEKMPSGARLPNFMYSIQIPIMARAQSRPAGLSSSSSPGISRVWNLRVHGDSFFEANREYSTRLDYPPYYGHLQAIILSESVARDGIMRSIDMLLRGPEMRRRTKVFVTPGEAFKLLEVSPKIDDYSAVYLKSLPINAKKTSTMLHQTDLGQVSKAIRNQTDFVLPRVISSSEEIKDAGAAVFKGTKMVGWLDESKTAYLKWITGNVKGGTLVINVSHDETTTLEVRKVHTKQIPVIKDGNVKMVLEIKAAMDIAEISSDKIRENVDIDFIRKVEGLAEEKLKKEVETTVSFVQREYGADIFLFDQTVSRYEPDFWDKVKDNWHDTFLTLKPEARVQIKIEQIGLEK